MLRINLNVQGYSTHTHTFGGTMIGDMVIGANQFSCKPVNWSDVKTENVSTIESVMIMMSFICSCRNNK